MSSTTQTIKANIKERISTYRENIAEYQEKLSTEPNDSLLIRGLKINETWLNHEYDFLAELTCDEIWPNRNIG